MRGAGSGRANPSPPWGWRRGICAAIQARRASECVENLINQISQDRLEFVERMPRASAFADDTNHQIEITSYSSIRLPSAGADRSTDCSDADARFEGKSLNDRSSEQQLIEALIARDRGAWRRFVEQFQGLVYARVARTSAEFHLRLDPAELEDICAEVFAGLIANDYASLRRFEGRSSLATWLSVIARRVAIRAMTKRAAAPNVTEIEGLSESASEQLSGSDSLHRMINVEETDRLLAKLNELNDADQFILRSFYLDGLSYLEISQRMEISTNTVGPKLQRAQQRLRQLLEEDAGPQSNQGARLAK